MPIEKNDSDLNVFSTATTTSVVNVMPISEIGLHILSKAGDHAGVIWRMYASYNGTTFFKTSQVSAAQVTDVNSFELFDTRGTLFIRFQVDVASGGAATEDLFITS